MSLQAHFPQVPDLALILNMLALLSAFTGGWLLLATRWRVLQAKARQAGASVPALPCPEVQLNQVFYRFGFAGLGLALLFSWGSRLL